MSISLIESARSSKQSLRSTVVSVALHAVVISLAVYATAHASEPIPSVGSDTTNIVYVASDPPIETHRVQGATTGSTVPAPKTARPLTFSPTLPATAIFEMPATTDSIGDDRGLFGTAGTSDSMSRGGHTGVDDAFDAHQVDKPALPRPGNPTPTYPRLLESSRVEGAVLAQFIVDTLGRADMSSFRILESSNDLFSQAVRTKLLQWRFFPAESGGRKVKQIVQLPLKFIAPNH